jgi:hypothetical protein
MAEPSRTPMCTWKRIVQREKCAIDEAGRAFAALSPLSDCIKCDGDRRDCRFFIDADDVHRQLHPSDDDQKV